MKKNELLQCGLNIINALETQPKQFTGKFWYLISIAIPLKNEERETELPTDLNHVIRKLINGKKSYGRVNNRDWFSRYFFGGFYKIIIVQNTPDELPTVHYLIQCYSDSRTVSEDITKSLQARIKMIAPTGNASISSSKQIDISNPENIHTNLLATINKSSQIFLDSNLVKELGYGFKLFCLNTLKEEIRPFGALYKIITPSFYHLQ